MLEVTVKPREGDCVMSDMDRVLNKLGRPECRNGRQLVIVKKYIDARHGNTRICYRVEDLTPEEIILKRKEAGYLALPYAEKSAELARKCGSRPVVAGFGPAGLFAGLVLARYGLRPVIIERGSSMNDRIRAVENVRLGINEPDPSCNVQFGEGGAGTFSDGKLFTGVNSGLISFVTREFVDHGACEDIMYDSHPHIGTDVLRRVIVSIREELQDLGAEVLFDTLFTGFRTENGRIRKILYDNASGSHELDCDSLILAPGNSARDTFRYLYRTGVAMEAKNFAVGVRIEHLRKDIDTAQYGIDTALTGSLSAANYKLAVDTVTGRKLYTFCMCPGGEVINSSSGPEQAVVNGMSYSGRDLDNSNSALLVPVGPEDYGSGVLDGIVYQEELERRAYNAGGGKIPVTVWGDLRDGKNGGSFGRVLPSVKPGYTMGDMNDIFDGYIIESIIDGIGKMGRKIRGFDDPDSVLSAVESRSSSPVRILRDKESRQSLNTGGLYPAGEGAGYAGGIMSSAVDGINSANALVSGIM
ncbi:hypothetical protein SAMN02910456_00281 [Ruminococcaceae bacterium YRB3002]|nr:hypothetical protein SAMN02910456_00281 [Ruminococcaceae bacterium YRB3002]